MDSNLQASWRILSSRSVSAECMGKGQPFPSDQEGAIVRAIVRAEELLRKLQDVAKMIGNDILEQAAWTVVFQLPCLTILDPLDCCAVTLMIK